MKIKHTLLCFGVMTMLFLVACQSERESAITATPIAAVTNTVMEQILVESTTTSPPPTATSVSDTAPTASATIALATATPSPTLAPPTIPAITLTPLPTLTADELETAVAELLANPMNCDVPCWWGAVPNETTVFELQQLLALYQFEDYYRRDDDDNQIPDYIEVWFTEDEFDFRVMYSFQNDVLQTVFSEQSPPLYEVLIRYGEPDEVWLETGFTPAPIPFRLNLVYYQEGMAFGYVADGTIQNNEVIGCFASNKTGLLRLIPPNSATSYMAFQKIFLSDSLYLPLTEATDMTMDEFMQQFSDPTQPQCIETPTELWE